MAGKSEFWELYRRPEWQRKRLEIMERDGFACSSCGSETKTLNVHHNVYFKDRKPWDYESHQLTTYCEDCHEKATEIELDFKVLMSGIDSFQKELLMGVIKAVIAKEKASYDEVAPIECVDSYEQARGVGLVYQIDPDIVVGMAINSESHTLGGGVDCLSAWPTKYEAIGDRATEAQR